MWFECASSNDDIAPSTEQLEVWFASYESDIELQRDVWHRYVLSRGRTLISWAKRQFFFGNASKEQIARLHVPPPR
jgi:hypothetical protein